MTKKIGFTSKPATSVAGNPDDWVTNRELKDQEPTKRLTIEVPLSLHKRMKAQCAMENLAMADVIRELLDQRFPNTSEPGGPS
jgi:hypothetical protein